MANRGQNKVPVTATLVSLEAQDGNPMCSGQRRQVVERYRRLTAAQQVLVVSPGDTRFPWGSREPRTVNFRVPQRPQMYVLNANSLKGICQGVFAETMLA